MGENINLNYQTIPNEELRQIIEDVEKELARRASEELEKAKENAITAINELINCCKKCNIRTLGRIYWECDNCDEGQYFDILEEDVLEDVAEILKNYN